MKLNKIFIVSLLLLAIIAMGAVSASEDIAGDVTAIEATDEASVQAVEEVEPADEELVQAVEEVEQNEEIISDSVEEESSYEAISQAVDDAYIVESADSDDVLADIGYGMPEFDAYIYSDVHGFNENIINIHSYTSKSGVLKIYVDENLNKEINVTNGNLIISSGSYSYTTGYKYFSPNELGISEYGSYSIKVTFTDNETGNEIIQGNMQVNITEFAVGINNVYTNTSPIVTLKSYSDKTGTIKIYIGDRVIREISLNDGILYIDEDDISSSKEFLPSELGITEYGSYSMKVTFTNATGTETVLRQAEVEVGEFNIVISWYSSIGGLYDSIVSIGSHRGKNGMISIYVDGVKKANYALVNGKFNKTGNPSEYLYVYPTELGIASGNHTIKVNFLDSETNNEKTVKEKTVSIFTVKIDEIFDMIGANEVLAFYVNFPKETTGTVTVYNYDNGVKGQKIGTSTIANGVAKIDISGIGANESKSILIEYSTNICNGNRTWYFDVMENSANVAVSVPKEIVAGNNAVVIFNAEKAANLFISVDGKAMTFYDITSFKYAIPDLDVGTHDVRIVFYSEVMGPLGPTMSSEIYLNSFKITVKAPAPVVKPVVKKLATKIVAKKKTFKVKTKVKKYAITLKAGKKAVKKVKVTLKVKGKTYKATTNAKGKATFKIKNLKKKGKYTATIKFAGNKNYKASSKKIKLTVKK